MPLNYDFRTVIDAFCFQTYLDHSKSGGVSRYCDQLKLSESTHILQPFLPSILEGLVQLAAQFSSEVLTLVMETLCIVCTVDPAFTTSAENKICPLTIAIFLKYNNGTAAALLTTPSVWHTKIPHSLTKVNLSLCVSSDPVVASLAQDIFKELAQIEGCQGPMQMRLIPTLVSIMQAPPDKIPSGLCAVSRHAGVQEVLYLDKTVRSVIVFQQLKAVLFLFLLISNL